MTGHDVVSDVIRKTLDGLVITAIITDDKTIIEPIDYIKHTHIEGKITI